MSRTDTIIAVSTPAGAAPRGIVRLSGDAAVPIVRAATVVEGGAETSELASYRALEVGYRLRCPTVPVPATLYVMLAPHSYTREDVVELHVPGAPAVLDMVVDDLLERGSDSVRLSEPGEFTRRAFLNGRIDLSQAEAVLAVIRARDRSELLTAAAALEGNLSGHCAELLDGIRHLRTEVEAALDFAPHGIELIDPGEIVRRCELLAQVAGGLIREAHGNTANSAGVRVALCGPPNAGKSSLLNRLCGSQRALVHARPGTTRDTVQASLQVQGVTFALADTAGVLADVGGADATAVEMARHALETAQLVILVLDWSRPFSQVDSEFLGALRPERTIAALNKHDLPQLLDEGELAAALNCPTIHTCALTGHGVANLRDELWRWVADGRVDASSANLHVNARQRQALHRAKRELKRAADAADAGFGYEFAAFNLREAAEELRRVTGESAEDDLLDAIFSRFCIGK